MTKAFPYVALFGESFSPNEAEKNTDIKFTVKNEVGEIGKRGKYKDKPYNFGYALLEPPKGIDDLQQIEWLVDTMVKNICILRKCGVIDGKFHVTYAYDSQCNIEYEPQFLSKLVEIGLAFTISCYEDESEFENDIE